MPKKLSQEEFIERCKKKHNSYYSYDKTVYTGMSNDDYIIVTCPIHGDFKQLAAGHIRGKGRKDCAGTITKTTEQFIIDARKVHGDEYDYSKSKYINAMTYIEIICRKHGSFWQKPNTHLIGKGCFECYGSKMLTQEEFINRCIEKHNGFYIYDKTVYTGCNYTITITCPVHGDFQQKAGAHLYGQGCSQCAHLISTQELELREFLGTIYENEMIFNSRAFIKPKELDIAVPVNIQENAHISTLSTDVTGLGKTILFRFKNDTASQDDMVLYMYGTTSLVGIQGSTLGGGFNVAKQGAVTCENSLLVRGGANFQSGVTLGQTLTVTGITTFLAVPQCSISPTATNQLTNKNYVDETIQQNINTTLEGVIKFASMTEAEYKALEVKSPSTIYYLTDVPLWVIGDQEIVTSNMPA